MTGYNNVEGSYELRYPEPDTSYGIPEVIQGEPPAPPYPLPTITEPKRYLSPCYRPPQPAIICRGCRPPCRPRPAGLNPGGPARRRHLAATRVASAAVAAENAGGLVSNDRNH